MNTHKFYACAIGLAASVVNVSAQAVPLDNTFTPAKVDLGSEYAGYDLHVDSQNADIYYPMPKSGRLVVNSGLILGPSGVDILPKLLAGGAGMLVNLEGIYRASLPGFKPVIEADSKKLYESYAWYAGYHDGVCTDITISDFFEKSVTCSSNGKDLNNNACSIKVTYTDTQGNTLTNVFDTLPSVDDDEDIKAWFNQNNERVKILWTAIDGLRKNFETRFLEPTAARKVEVDKTPTRGFAFRADRSKSKASGSYRFEQDMLQSVGPKRKTITGYKVGIKVDGSTDAVSSSILGNCPAYYGKSITAAETLPVVDTLNQPSNNPENPISGTSIAWD